MKNNAVYTMTLSALLMAIAIIIPMFSPIKIQIEPASFTLASHVAIMIAMFLSPVIGITVNLGATLGFFLAGSFPIVVVLRAFSQVIFVAIGAYILKKSPKIMSHWASMIGFCLGIGIIHGICEVIVCLPFYTSLSMAEMMYPVFVLVGIGTLVHSTIDFGIAVFVWKYLLRSRDIQKMATVKQLPF